MSLNKPLLTILVLILLALCFSLGLVIRYPYANEVENNKNATCLVTNCVLEDLCSCGKCNCICYHFNATLFIDGNTYTKIMRGMATSLKVCDGLNETECYYDSRHIEKSLSLYQSRPIHQLVIGLTVTVCTLLFFLVASLTVILCNEEKYDDDASNEEMTNEEYDITPGSALEIVS